MLASISYPPIPIFELGPLSLSLHGVFAALGFLGGALLMIREVRARGFSVDAVSSVLSWALVASILGARLFTVPVHLGDPGYGFSNIVGLGGDFSILGGYAGGILGGWLRMRMLKIDVRTHMDTAAAGLALGAVIGRIGDLAIVEHLGSRTDFFLGFGVKPGHDLSPQHNVLECVTTSRVDGLCAYPIDDSLAGIYHHTALYDMLGAIVLLGVVFLLHRTWTNRRYGQLFSFWIVWYGFQRFLIDFARFDAADAGLNADSVVGPFTGSQWGGLLASLLGVALLLWFRKVSVPVSAEEDRRLQAVTAAAVAPPEVVEVSDD
jgi:phosphatidylglycerol:prolipoprotein diacylglycerol transferase